MTVEQRFRVLIAKPGLDGHDRGAKVVALALRDAGFEVVYLGLRRKATEIVSAAIQEDADLIGLSVLSGAHLPLARKVLDELERQQTAIPVVLGGTIPPQDVPRLLDEGIAAVFPTSTPLSEVTGEMRRLAEEHVERESERNENEQHEAAGS